MNFFRTLEFAMIVVIIYVLITQVIMPLYRGRPMFLTFRSKQTRLRDELAQANLDRDDRVLQREVKQAKSTKGDGDGTNA